MPNRHIKIFISYAWTSPEYQQHVIDFATKLRSNGIDAILDVWHLKAGEDKYKFMESSVTNPEIERVIILCNGEYKRKADCREGGVGSETMIISPKVMNLTNPGKFLPVVFEKSSPEENVIPVYLEHMIFIDLHNKDTYNNEYKKLVLQINNLPTYSIPKLGEHPDYVLTQSSHNLFVLKSQLDEMKNSIHDYNIDFQEILYKFSLQFVENLKEYMISSSQMPEKLLDRKIDEMLEMRDLFLEALSCALARKDANVVEFTARLFEKIANEIISDSKSSAYYEHFSYLIWESVICTVSMLFKREKIDELHHFLLYPYKMHFPGSWKQHQLRVTDFSYRLTQYEEYMKNNSSRKLYSFAAEKLIKHRCWKYEITPDDLVTADYILFQTTYYLSKCGHSWRPFLFVYGGYIEDADSLLNNIWTKLVSRSYCTKVLPLFGAKNIEELKIMLTKFEVSSMRIYQDYWGEPLPPVYPMKYLSALASEP